MSIDQQPTDNLRKMPRPTETLEHRVMDIEKHNQIRRIESTDGLTFFDTDLGQFQITNSSGSISFTAGIITYKDSLGNIIRQQSGIDDKFYDANGKVSVLLEK